MAVIPARRPAPTVLAAWRNRGSRLRTVGLVAKFDGRHRSLNGSLSGVYAVGTRFRRLPGGGTSALLGDQTARYEAEVACVREPRPGGRAMSTATGPKYAA